MSTERKPCCCCLACGQPINVTSGKDFASQCCSEACANFVAGVFDASDLGKPNAKDAREELEIAKNEYVVLDEYNFGEKILSKKKVATAKKEDLSTREKIKTSLGDASFDLDDKIKTNCVRLDPKTLIECKTEPFVRQAVGEILSAQANVLLKDATSNLQKLGADLNLEKKTIECMLWTGETWKKHELIDVIVFISPSEDPVGEQKKPEAIPAIKVSQNLALFVLRRMFHDCLLGPYQTVIQNKPVMLRSSYVMGYSPAATYRRALAGKIRPDDLACVLVECGVARPDSKKKCEDKYAHEIKTPILHKVNLSTVPKAKVLPRGGGLPGSEIPNPRLYAPSRRVLALHNQAFLDAATEEPTAFVLCKHLETAEVLYKNRILKQVEGKKKWIAAVKTALANSASADETRREVIRKTIVVKSNFWISEDDEKKSERHLKTYAECYDRCDIEVWELGGLPDTFIKIDYKDIAERTWERLSARIGIPMRDSYSLLCVLAIAYGEQWPIALRESGNTFYGFPSVKKDKYKLSHVAYVTVPAAEKSPAGWPRCECGGKTFASSPPAIPEREPPKIEKTPHVPPSQPPPSPPSQKEEPKIEKIIPSSPPPIPARESAPSAKVESPPAPVKPIAQIPESAPSKPPSEPATPVSPAKIIPPPPPRSKSPVTAEELKKGRGVLKTPAEPLVKPTVKEEPQPTSAAEILQGAMAARRGAIAPPSERTEEDEDWDAAAYAKQFPGSVGSFAEYMACI